MIQGYLKFKCIEKLEDDYKSKFINIVEFYRPKLNTISNDCGSVYTLHDFDHHCCNLYNIASNIILNEETAFAVTESSLSQSELYLLDLAILLHDIGMTKLVDFSRDNHSALSAEIIKKDYSNNSNPLSESYSGLSKNEIDALMLIVKAHSDVKDGSVPEEENGLKNPKLNNSVIGRWNKIRAKFLANILRLADELDITNTRLGGGNALEELEEAAKQKKIIEGKIGNTSNEEDIIKLKEELKRYENAEFSLERWNRLKLFSSVERDESGKVILNIDESAVEDCVGLGDDEREIAKTVAKIYDKIDREFKQFRCDIEVDLRYEANIAIKKIEVYTANKSIQTYIEKRKSENKDESNVTVSPKVISKDLEEKISRYIEDNNLYEVGHFKLHDNLCARDWISVEEIITTEDIYKKCEKQLLLHIKKREKDEGFQNYIIIGIDFYGMLIASRLSFILNKPYTYLIPDYKESNSTLEENGLGISIDEYDDVILVTDVIVTFETIKQITKKYKIDSKIKAVYAVLFRDTSDHRFILNNEKIANNTYFLNGEYNIEIRENDDCKYRNNIDGCKASNKTLS